jgi:hypothetical protein
VGPFTILAVWRRRTIPLVLSAIDMIERHTAQEASAFVVISFIEGKILVPAIEGRSFALPPAIVAPVIAIGLALGGALGAALSVPTASAARDVYLYLFRRAEDALPGSALADPERPSPVPDPGSGPSESPIGHGVH